MKGLKLFAKILFPIICLLTPLFVEINVHIGKEEKSYVKEIISYSEYLTRLEKSKRQSYGVPHFRFAELEIDSNRILYLGSPISAKAALYLIWLIFASGIISIVIFFILPLFKPRQISKVKGGDTKSYYDALENDELGYQKKYNIEPDDHLGLEAGTFLLSSGRRVKVDKILVKKTYAGFLEGRVTRDYNSRLFQTLTYPKDWGDSKAFKISPSEDEFNSFLKGSFISVLLTSHTPIQKQNSGSQLIISWFDYFPFEKPLLKYIQDSLKDVNWTELAEDFNY